MIREMRKLYQNLYDTLAKNGFFNKNSITLSTLVPMKGNRYDDETIKLMLVGRAPNGWYEMVDNYADKPEQYVDEAMALLLDNSRFHWADDKRLSHFWNYTKSILEEIRGYNFDQRDWYQSIVWTNLFPVSPKDGGNPSDRLAYSQYHIARRLLQTEIEYYNPTHILFVTGWDGWFNMPRKPKYCLESDELFLENIEKEDKVVCAVQGSGMYKDSRVVVTCRPERYKKACFVSDVKKGFIDLEGTLTR